MEEKKGWSLKGTFYECCRALDGQCGLQFGREMPHSCACLTTYQIKQGQIKNVDMKGINIFFLMDEIGPKPGTVEEGAIYISDNATEKQREILKHFVFENMEGRMWKKTLGLKFIKIDVSEKDGTYSIKTPVGEQNLTLTIGGDGKNPIRMENGKLPFLSDVKICNTQLWKFHDYGKNLEYRNTSGQVAEFALQGE
jgi:hypothetical protein